MSKEKKAAADSETGVPMFQCLGQGVRDLSLECPVPAYVLGKNVPEMSLDLGVTVVPRQDPEGTAEVILSLRANAVHEEASVFLVELAYGGLFVAQNIDEERFASLLHVEGASLLFPFARHVLMAAISEGGYRPPVLDPVNFAGLYRQSLEDKKSKEE